MQFLKDCRPISVSMGNAIKSLKTVIGKLGHEQVPDMALKAEVLDHIDRYIQERIVVAGNVIVEHAVSKIKDGVIPSVN